MASSETTPRSIDHRHSIAASMAQSFSNSASTAFSSSHRDSFRRQNHFVSNSPLNPSPSSSFGGANNDANIDVSSIANGDNIDIKTINKHLLNPQDSLKLPGGDVTRNLYYINKDAKIRRSSSFSKFLDDTRRSSASELQIPGGFRRDFLTKKYESNPSSKAQKPSFLTNNFLEFLSIYGHFAGEDFEEYDSTKNSSEDNLFDDTGSVLIDEESPLLPIANRHIKQEPRGTASTAKTFFLLFKSLVGSGVLFLPRAFYNGGLLFSTIALIGFGLLTFFCYLVLIQSKISLGLGSFGELGFHTYGKIMRYFILFSIIMSQVGFVATYIVFTAENMLSFLTQVTSIGDYLTKLQLVVIQCFLLIPLVLIRDLTKLSITSIISSVCIVWGLVTISYYSGLQLFTHGVSDVANFNSKSWSMLIGVAVTAFEGVGLILPIQASMKEPEKFPRVLFLTMMCITALFVFVGVIGYTAFGSQVASIIILSLPGDHISVQMIQCFYSLAVFLTGPLQLFPVTRILETVLFSRGDDGTKSGKLYSGKFDPRIKWLKNIERSLLVAAISAVAYLGSSNLDKFVSFNGCFACIPLVYIYPPMIHLRSMKREENKLFYLDILIVTVGVVAVFYTTYQILFLN